MDNHWQMSKCGSTWQSSTEPAAVVAPSPGSQAPPQDSSRNSMINASHYSYPHTVQGPCSSTLKMKADPSFQTTNFNLYNSVMGTSFFTLLSGPPPFSQYDSQQVLSSKPSNPSSKVRVYNSSPVVCPTEHKAPFDNRYLKSNSDTFPVPVRTLASDGGNTASCLHDIVQARKVSDPSLELAKAANYHTSHGIGLLNGFSSLKVAPISGSGVTPVQSGKLHSSSSSIPHQLSPLTNGLPRVFCLYASGDLFLSNSGLLGVVCSCHGFRMSISKFSEHSGLQDVNPGDAVHTDSGETIARWRKAYFCKLGIRIPEDQGGWHWPEGLSEPADSIKTSERVPNVSRSSNSANPPRAFVASKQPLNEFPDSHHLNQNLVHGNCKLPNGFTEASHEISHRGVANNISEQPVSRGVPVSKLAGGTGNATQSGPRHIDPIYKTKNSFTSVQSLRRLGKDSDKFNDSRDSVILEKATVSSNIELRLGQPSPQSQTLGKSSVLGFITPGVSRDGHPLELISSKPLISDVHNERITDESKHFVNCAAQAAKSSSIEGQHRLRFSNLGFGAYSTRAPFQPAQLKGEVVAGPVLFSHMASSRSKMQLQDSHSGANDGHVMPKQHVKSQICKLDPVNFGCNIDNSTKITFNPRDMENYKLMDRNQLANSSNSNLNSLITLQSKSIERRDGYKLGSGYNPPELATKSVHPGTASWPSGGAEKSAMISVSRETSFQVRDNGVQNNLLRGPYQTGPPLPKIVTSENICSSSGHGNCCQDTPCAYVPDKCSCWVQRDGLIRSSNLEGKDLISGFGEPLQIRSSMVSASNLDKGCTLHSSDKIGETIKPNSKKVEFNAFQWKDVPSKMSEKCHVPCKEQTNKFLEDKIDVNDQSSEKVDRMKEQVMSNISSKCSGPALTQASVKVSNGDSCTDDAQNTGCAKNFAVDEGSGIQKSWSSDDVLDSGSNIRFDGITHKIDLKNTISGQSTRTLIDELRVIDSLRSKKMHNHEKSKTSEKDSKGGKRKREMKFKILDPVSSVSTGSSGQSSQSLEHLTMVVQPSQEVPKNCTCKTPRRAYDDCHEIPESSRVKKVKLNADFLKPKYERKNEVPCKRITRPVVCGRYGLISNGDTSRPAKIFSLGKVLKSAKRCGNTILKKSPSKALKKSITREGNRRSGRISNLKVNKYRIGQGASVSSDDDLMEKSEGTEMTCSPQWSKDADTSYVLEKGTERQNERRNKIPYMDTRARQKSKEVRKRSLYELITKGKDSDIATISKNTASLPQDNLKNDGNGNNLDVVDNTYRSPEELTCKSTPDVDTFCHVCRSLNNDEMNCLLECKQCLVKVHQACYGVSKVPKSYWYCRPCKANATNMACVLCGYEGGVMTRAIHSCNIVRSLLNVWNVITESEENRDNLNADVPSTIPKSFSVADMMATKSPHPMNATMVLNSITAGVFDSTVKQWVHMVCGLWTPGTRCPNVDTMSAFDVSGACYPEGNVVCSMCKRPGGCCIRCRVVDCAIHFHPWCAHRKGLLQSEVEGAYNDKVGFYGRCELHATQDHCDQKSHSLSTQVVSPNEKETCARTEGYKGRKREGFRHDGRQNSSGSGGCLVRQEQVDAWNHINRQLSTKRRLQNMPQPVQDVEYDFRKEYARYKQSKSWKHLVVYKSGIHALGLYTSLFISQSAMVVEYVGEIVGLRVADRRESEYQSGKQLQYKSACYFFRIDKEHIIDATRTGGIARFVNHSCQPNCVAKVITVRGEKKVVFFAERDIYPGEEITYDYHFSNEDEGKKILCSCNSSSCRRYLN